MLGAKSVFAEECYQNNFIGADFDIAQDLQNELPENWKDFNKKFVPIWLSLHPEKTKISAGLACGMLWSVCKGLNVGDVVLCPTGQSKYYVGEIQSDYYYSSGASLPHQRKVKWFPLIIDRSDMSLELKNSSGSVGTVSDITRFQEEIERLIDGQRPPTLISTDESIEDPSAFALEKHLEEYLIANWKQTELGRNFEIYQEEGENVGQQYPSDTGPIDILAISKDKKTILVVELKKGRASDNVVGQIQRYMGYVQEELAEKDQNVKGVIIAFEDDLRIKRALSVTSNIEFYRYQLSFKLIK